MLVDANTYFSTDQAITGDEWSDEYIDLKALGDAVNNTTTIIVNCTESFNTLTSMDIQLKCHEDTGFSTGTKTLFSKNQPLANLTSGKTVAQFKIPSGCERYLKMYYDCNGSNPSTGKITAFVAQAGNVGEVSDS